MNTNHNRKNTCNIDIHNIDITMLKRTIAFVAIIVLSFVSAYGQNTTIILNADSNGKSTYVECGRTYNFYDSGGAGGDYKSYEDFSYTFESCRPINIKFTSLATESSTSCYNYDYLLLYNESEENLIIRGQTGCSSSLSVGTTYTANSGTLIIKWKSDVSSNAAGWAAEITCSGEPCPPHILTYNTTANCSGIATDAPVGATAVSATITSTIPTCSSAPNFKGWNTEQDGSGTSYVAGEDISLLREDITLYAQYTDCNEYTVVEGSSQTEYIPFYSFNRYFSYTQQLYTKSKICSDCDENKMIRSVIFQYYGTEDQTMNFDLYMGNTDATNLNDGWITGLQCVATNKTITFTPGWVEIPLDGDGFIWNHTKNIVIAMHNKNKPDDNNSKRKFYYLSESKMSRYYANYSAITLNDAHIPNSNGDIRNELPNLKLCLADYCEPPTFLFSTASATCALGGSYDLTDIFTLNNPTGRPVTYSCDPAQATILGTTITPLVGGDITITAHIDAYNGNCAADAIATLTATCTDSQFEFNQYGVFCTIGNNVSAPSYTKTSTSTSITYSSDDESIAIVNPSTGVVTGISEGYTTITAYLASSGNFCQKTATFVAYVSPDESCMPFTAGNCNVHLSDHCESPFYTNNYYTYSYVQMLYPAEELRASGLCTGKINKIAFHYYGRPTGDPNFSQKFRLFIAPTSATSLYDNWATPSSEFVKKFDGEKSFVPDSWTYIELTDGFDWDGTSNILIAINTYETDLPPTCQFCTRNSDQLARYVGKQSSEIGGATEIPLNASTKLPPFDGSASMYRADIKFCQDASTIILPIELSKFEANCNNNRVNITWTTESEKNNEAFIIERSQDAIDFTEIARIGGSVNSIETINYQYTDENPNTGDNYYRLVQIDTDGTRTQSEIIVAKCHGNKLDNMQVEAYPNPFNDELTISLYNFNGQNTSIEIFDMLGKTIATKTITNPDNYYETTLNLDGFPKAAYSVRISANGATINKLVVKN
ncbi:MAG: T9SS type A sorting domain-containing protein [Bacteroidales bacterium]|nr:T9SS type A sorting domain-containing protein [Bacteroidales bacterium]